VSLIPLQAAGLTIPANATWTIFAPTNKAFADPAIKVRLSLVGDHPLPASMVSDLWVGLLLPCGLPMVVGSLSKQPDITILLQKILVQD
jgi:hypothetical protein